MFLATYFTESLTTKMMDSCDIHFAFSKVGANGKETRILPAHKDVLVAGSRVFHEKLVGNNEKNMKVDIEHYSYDEFKEFLQFFYVKTPPINKRYITAVIRLLDKYNMRNCLPHCENTLKTKFKPATICSIYDMATKYKLSAAFVKEIENYIKVYAQEIFKTDKFLNCKLSTLKSILKLDTLICESELEIFRAAMNWAGVACHRNKKRNDGLNKRKMLAGCFRLIRFTAMSVVMFLELIDEYKDVFKSNECYEFFQFKLRDKSLKTFTLYTPRVTKI